MKTNNGLTIKDLIEILKQYPQDLRVVVDGYEDGLNDISIFTEITIALNVNEEDCLGAHLDMEDLLFFPGDKERIKETQKGLRIAGKNTYAESIANK